MTSTGLDVVALHRRAVEAFAERLRDVAPAQWSAPTRCADWDVRTLVNHVLGEIVWTAPLLAGKTIAEVGDVFDGDLLGADPVAAWDSSVGAALAAAAAPGAMQATVHLSFGDFPGSEYTSQLFADYLVHGWDLASAIGSDTTLDPELVAACVAWFGPMEQAYRDAGAIGPRPDVPADADPQAALLAMFGRTPEERARAEGRKPSEIAREALDRYLSTPRS